MPLLPLPPDLLRRRCDPAELGFATTAALEPLDGALGQDRPAEALRFAIAMRAQGYNVFALGPEGTGKLWMVRRLMEEAAQGQPAPDDWCYVNNFDEPHKPRALRLPGGTAQTLRRDMDHLIEELAAALPAAFEGDEYRSRRQALEERYKERQEAAFGEVQRHAEKRHVALIRTPMGLALAPTRDGEVLTPDAFGELPEQEQARFREDMADLQGELETVLKSVPQWERQQREELRQLHREVAAWVVGHALEDLLRRTAALPQVLEHLQAVRDHIVENYREFVGGDDEKQQPNRRAMLESGPFRRLRVNVLVANGGGGGAPVVHEDHPTQPNLCGRVEHIAQFGALVTDFNLIKPGALHLANGGYLVLDARKVLMQPFAYEELKRVLKARELRIQSPYQALGLMGTVSLEPEPIPLDLKVVLLGEPLLYYLLSQYDPDFHDLFKVQADFEYRMDRDPGTVRGFARLVAGLAGREGLRPFAAEAVARLVEEAARLAGDAEKLTTHMASVFDLVRESDHWAGQTGAGTVTAAHVDTAVAAQVRRADRVRGHVQEDILRETLLVDTDGEAVGQINGLAVLQLGRFAFGKPSRITARIRMGRGEFVDIEREVQLGGPLHSKGVLILSSFLASRFGQNEPLSLSASLVFEQSYGGVDGDSASAAELHALLSAVAEVPIRQSFAVTGSVNQYGQVQAIGGVNEKVEGFFDICVARGLTGRQGVLIPAANVKHLMLRPDVVAACAEKRFHIHAVESIDQGIELLTGLPAGEPGADGAYPPGTVYRKVAARLAALGRRRASSAPRDARTATAADATSRAERPRDQRRGHRSERIGDGQAVHGQPVVPVLADQKDATGLPGRGEQHRVPEREPVRADQMDRLGKRGTGCAVDGKGRTQAVDDLSYLRRRHPGACQKPSAQFAEALQDQYPALPVSATEDVQTCLVTITRILIGGIHEDVRIEGEAHQPS